MKKVIALIAVLALSIFSLAACGDSQDNSSKQQSNTDSKQTNKSQSTADKSNEQSQTAYDLNGKKLSMTQQNAIDLFKKQNPHADLTKIELDSDHGKLIYKVEGADNDSKYKMEFDANSKKMLTNKSERLEQEDKAELKNEKLNLNDAISPQEAMKKAVAKKNGPVESYELDTSYGNMVYDVSIREKNGSDSEVRINAKNGSVIGVEND